MCARRKKKTAKKRYETTINTETLGVEQRGSGGGDPELCLRGRWVEGRVGKKKDSYDKLR